KGPKDQKALKVQKPQGPWCAPESPAPILGGQGTPTLFHHPDPSPTHLSMPQK
ncbi:hypothetical protein L0F63_005754, partial [Massospora cicadina]